MTMMNTDSYFIDSNLLVYLISGDSLKAQSAERLVLGGPVISVQVLNEFTAVARRKHKKSFEEIAEVLNLAKTAARMILPITVDMHERAIEIASTTNIRIYDACIVAAAELAGCKVLYTEDMNNGQRIGDVTLRNPFALT
jgi:predicted nucleic acid-binding protein